MSHLESITWDSGEISISEQAVDSIDPTLMDDYSFTNLMSPLLLNLFGPPSPVRPIRSPELQSIRSRWIFSANVITAESASICYWPITKMPLVMANTPFSVQFMFTPAEGGAGFRDLFFRCTVVYADQKYEHLVVRRCKKATHTRKHSPSEGTLGIIEAVDDSALYYGSGSDNSPYSVVVPGNAPSTTVQYQMVYWTSCGKGQLALDFTAEDRSGAVYGRHRIDIRSCANPRRDVSDEERRLNNQPKEEPTPTMERQVQPAVGANPLRDVSNQKDRLKKKTVKRAGSAEPEEQPRPTKKRLVQLPVEDQVSSVEDQVSLAEYQVTPATNNSYRVIMDNTQMGHARLVQAAEWLKWDADIVRQINSVIENVQKSYNFVSEMSSQAFPVVNQPAIENAS